MFTHSVNTKGIRNIMYCVQKVLHRDVGFMRALSLRPSCSRPHLRLLICFATTPESKVAAADTDRAAAPSPQHSCQLPVQLLSLTIYQRTSYYIILRLRGG